MKSNTLVGLCSCLLAWGCSPDTPSTQPSNVVVQPTAAGTSAAPASATSPAALPSAAQSAPAPRTLPPAFPGGAAKPPAAQVPAAASGAPASMTPPSTAPASGATPTTPAAPMGKALAATSDPWTAGPYKFAQLDMAGPKQDATVLYPMELGKDGVKHPFAVWGNGAGAQGPDHYRTINNLVPSHGILVYITHQSSQTGSELVEGIDWMIAENSRAGSMFEGKLDTTHIASMGQSMGSLATFAIAGDPRLTTTVHLSGGSGFARNLALCTRMNWSCMTKDLM